MYTIRSLGSVPLAKVNEFETVWQQRQEALTACPGVVDPANTGLWTSLASPMRYLVLTVFDDYDAARAAVRGALGAFWQEHTLPAGVAAAMEGWESIATAEKPENALGDHRYLRQAEWTVRPGREAAFEEGGTGLIALVVKHNPVVQAAVFYRNPGVPGRYRVVYRSTDQPDPSFKAPEELRAYQAAHPVTDYADTYPQFEVSARAL